MPFGATVLNKTIFLKMFSVYLPVDSIDSMPPNCRITTRKGYRTKRQWTILRYVPAHTEADCSRTLGRDSNPRPLHLRENIDCGCLRTGALRGMFGHKREEVVEGWRRLNNEKLHNLYASPNINRKIISKRMASGEGACIGHGIDEKFIQNFGRKS
jgi:hypothetical protein